MSDRVQIDMVRIEGNAAICSLMTSERSVRIAMSKSDYEALTAEGFFIRKGDQPDCAGILNTTDTYIRKDSQ